MRSNTPLGIALEGTKQVVISLSEEMFKDLQILIRDTIQETMQQFVAQIEDCKLDIQNSQNLKMEKMTQEKLAVVKKKQEGAVCSTSVPGADREEEEASWGGDFVSDAASGENLRKLQQTNDDTGRRGNAMLAKTAFDSDVFGFSNGWKREKGKEITVSTGTDPEREEDEEEKKQENEENQRRFVKLDVKRHFLRDRDK